MYLYINFNFNNKFDGNNNIILIKSIFYLYLYYQNKYELCIMLIIPGLA